MSRKTQCKKVNELPGYEQARSWWRSRLPEEKSVFIPTEKYLFYPTITLRLPVPLQGYLAVRKELMGISEETTVILGSEQIDRLRNLYKKGNAKGWIIRPGNGCFEFIRPGRVVCVGRSGAERFLWP